VNTKGELVGINSQILSNSDGNIGIGFAIPVNMAKNVMEQLRTKGKVTRAQLGVTVQGVTSEMAESLGLKQANGAIVSGVAPGSAAERAGVKRGDVIQSFNGVAVHDTNTLRNRVAEAGPGTTSELVVIRDGSEKRLSVKLDEANPEKSARARDGEPETADNTALGRFGGAADAGAGGAREGPEGDARVVRGGRRPGRPRGRGRPPAGRHHPGSESPGGHLHRRSAVGGEEVGRASRRCC
jgi:serine protease Do